MRNGILTRAVASRNLHKSPGGTPRPRHVEPASPGSLVAETDGTLFSPPGLLFAGDGRYHDDMTLSQLLKHVKALPARERERLLREILVLEERSRAARLSRGDEPRVTWPDVEVRGRRIVGDRVLPNLVLLERGEETS
jgi:hypothetical protein